MRPDVVRRYTERAAEYAAQLGTMASVHPTDEHLVTTWAAFTGDTVEPFDHVVTTAWHWKPEALAAVLHTAGFDVVETHARTVPAARPRPHGAIVAQRRT